MLFARVGYLTVVLIAVACSDLPSDMGGFPGVSIKASCRRGSTQLPCVSRKGEAYRFHESLGGEFGGRSRIITVILDNNDSRVVVVTRWSHLGTGGIWNTSLERHAHVLGRSERIAVAKHLADAELWNLPANVLPPRGPHYFDYPGSWTLEGFKRGRFHKLTRLANDVELQAIAELLLSMSKSVETKHSALRTNP